MLDRRSPRNRDLRHGDGPVDSTARVARDRTVRSIHEVAAPPATDPAPALPVPSSVLIGRDAEVERLVALLSDPAIRLVTLTGPGGTGKTRLALAVAEAMQYLLTDGAIFVDLSAVTRATDVVPAIVQALGLRERVGQDRLRQIIDFLRPKERLLVLDNVEQIIDAAPQIAQIALEATGSTVLVTSRAPLRVGSEREIPVPPLLLAASGATPDDAVGLRGGAPLCGAGESTRPIVSRGRAVRSADRRDLRSPGWVAAGDRTGSGPGQTPVAAPAARSPRADAGAPGEWSS